MGNGDELVIWIILGVLFGLVGLVRKVLEKAGANQPQRPARPGARPGPAQGKPDVGQQLRNFLNQLTGEGEGAEEKAPPRPAPVRPQPEQRAPRPAQPRRQRPAPARQRPASVTVQRAERPRAVQRLVSEERAPEARRAAKKEQRKRRAQAAGPARRAATFPLPFSDVSRDKLKEAVVWAEVLGKPRALRAWRAR